MRAELLAAARRVAVSWVVDKDVQRYQART